MSKTARRPSLGGRPPSGPGGEKVSAYPVLTVRLPRPTKDALVSLSAMRRTPMWQLLDEMIRAHVEALPRDERRVLGEFVATMTSPDP